MKIVTWNVNSVKAREERLIAFLERSSPDVVLLQELKTEGGAFPQARIEALGYHAVFYGQKTYNGVAILSRTPVTDVVRSFGDGVEDPQARFIAAHTGGVRVASVYVPNGSTVGSDKYTYKLEWLRRLSEWVKANARASKPLAIGGDYNVAPDDLDVARPAEWAETVLCAPGVRKAFAELCELGLTDTFRAHHPEGKIYSWWDYRALGFPKNDGLRIDHILATEALAKKSVGASVDRDERKGTGASDHAPVMVEFDV